MSNGLLEGKNNGNLHFRDLVGTKGYSLIEFPSTIEHIRHINISAFGFPNNFTFSKLASSSSRLHSP